MRHAGASLARDVLAVNLSCSPPCPPPTVAASQPLMTGGHGRVVRHLSPRVPPKSPRCREETEISKCRTAPPNGAPPPRDVQSLVEDNSKSSEGGM